jgi:hypothetical protein
MLLSCYLFVLCSMHPASPFSAPLADCLRVTSVMIVDYNG